MTARTAARGARADADGARRIPRRRNVWRIRATTRIATPDRLHRARCREFPRRCNLRAPELFGRQDAGFRPPGAVRAVSTTPFPSSDGGTLAMSQFSGAPLVLYFYEGQSCGACQTQMVEVQGAMAELEAMGAHVLGVTMDPVGVSASVAAQLHLSYPIVEDIDHQARLGDGHLRGERAHGRRRSALRGGAGSGR